MTSVVQVKMMVTGLGDPWKDQSMTTVVPVVFMPHYYGLPTFFEELSSHIDGIQCSLSPEAARNSGQGMRVGSP